jgi:oligosaccharide repeat unit polymerase
MQKLFDLVNFPMAISIIIIILIIGYNFVSAYKSKQYYRFWSPMTFISLVFFYYVIYVPFSDIMSEKGATIGNTDLSYGLSYAWCGACVSLCCIAIGFKFARFKYKADTTTIPLQENKLVRIGVVIFVLGTLAYSVYHPIRFSIGKFEDDFSFKNMGTWGSYFNDAISIFVCACCLFIPAILKKKKYYLLLFILLAFITYTIGGFRYRLIYILISLATMYHLYFRKNIKYRIWIPVAIAFFLFTGIMTYTRTYSKGLDLDAAKGMSMEEIMNGSNAEGSVFYYSGAVMKQVENRGAYIYFEPVITAIMMPVPRKLYAEKPTGNYLAVIQQWVFGSIWGAATLTYTEAFYAFGWFGIVLQGLFIGWGSKYFWLRFLNNKNAFNSILLLSLFNGYTYFMLSRGYLAAQFQTIMFFIVVPYFLYKWMFKFKNKKI